MSNCKVISSLFALVLMNSIASASEILNCKSVLWDSRAGATSVVESLSVSRDFRNGTAMIKTEVDGISYDLEFQRESMNLMVFNKETGEASSFQCKDCKIGLSNFSLQMKIKGTPLHPQADRLVTTCSGSKAVL